MRSVSFPILFASLLAASSYAADYTVKDSGGFASTGRLIEVADRYGWASYEIVFDFGLDMGERRLTNDSALTLTIHMKNGSSWDYRCRAKADRQLWANINQLLGKGVSVLAECRIDPKSFAKAVDLDSSEVGEPMLVFHAMIEDGQARAGQQKGFYFLPAGQIGGSPFGQYASRSGDPSDLGVLFASSLLHPHNPQAFQTSRWLP